LSYLKPLPTPSIANGEFWDGLKRHEFVVPRCNTCGDYGWVPYPACRTCQSEELTWTPVTGDATVYSFSVVHRGIGAFNDEVPYVVVLGKLVEEPRPMIVMANMVADCPLGSILIGMPIKIVYEDIPDEDMTMFKFAPREL
jgi:uncharacterized OB-fold protein